MACPRQFRVPRQAMGIMDHPEAWCKRLDLEWRPHRPLARIFVPVEIASTDVVVHTCADVGRGDLHIESAMETLLVRLVASLLFEKLDRDGRNVDDTRWVIHCKQHSLSHFRFGRLRPSDAPGQ